MKKYIDEAMAHYKKYGTAVPFIDKLKLTKAKKSELLNIVMMAARKRPAKVDPFYEKPKPKKKSKKTEAKKDEK